MAAASRARRSRWSSWARRSRPCSWCRGANWSTPRPGTRGPIGVRSGGGWDGEVACWRSPLSKNDLFRGGLDDLGPDGPEAFRESLVKHVAALQAVTPFDRLYLSGAAADRPEIAAIAPEALVPVRPTHPPALASRAPGSSTPRRARRCWPTASPAGRTPTSSLPPPSRGLRAVLDWLRPRGLSSRRLRPRVGRA